MCFFFSEKKRYEMRKKYEKKTKNNKKRKKDQKKMINYCLYPSVFPYILEL